MKSASFKQLTQSPVPVLIDFYADWCGPCKAQAPVVQQVASHFGDKVKVIKINTDKNPELSSSLNIKSIPTLMVYQNGAVKWKHAGFASLGQLKQVLEGIV